MASIIDANAIPSAKTTKKIETVKVELKNVLFGEDGTEDITAEVIPFNLRNNQHRAFAYEWADMRNRLPSPFMSESDASREYVRLFMVHSKADELNQNSNFSKVVNDLRASRTLLNQEDIIQALYDFFGNA